MLAGALLDLAARRLRPLRRARDRLAARLLRARSRGTPEPLAPFFRDLEEGGAALVIGAGMSGLLLLLFGPGRDDEGLRRLLIALPVYLGGLVVVLALARLLLLAPRALGLWLLRLGVVGTERLVRRALRERGAPGRIPFTYAALLAAEVVVAAWAGVALASWR